MQDELVVLQRVPQLVLQRQLPRHPLGHLLGIEQVALASRFRSLERRLGILQQRVGIGTVTRKYRDPELGGDPKVWIAYRVRSAEDLAVPLFHNSSHVVFDLHIGDQHRKLVAAKPGEQAWLRSEAQAARGDLLEQLIAGLAAQSVVDGVKVLDVEEDDCKLPLLTRRCANVLVEALMEQIAIGHTREGVMKGKVVEFFRLGHMVQCESDVSGQLKQQPHLRFNEKSNLRGV